MQLVAALAVVLANAHVLTMDPAHPQAQVVAIADGKIAYVGDDLALARKAAGPGAEVIDAAGRTVMPGFNDAHVHFGLTLTLGSREHGVDLPDLGKRAFVAAVKQAAQERAPGWLFVKMRTMPDGIGRARDLDFVDRALFLVTAHGGLFNHRALAEGHFSTEEAPDGFVHGRELAAALDRLVKALPLKVLTNGAHTLLQRLAKGGITSVQLIDEVPEVFELLRQRDQLTARVRMIPLGYRLETRLYEPTWKGGDPAWVRVDGIKYFHDDGARITRFELQEIFERDVLAAHRQVVVHVLSRHALDTLLSSIESMVRGSGKPEASRLFRVEHADDVTPDQARRLAKLGIPVCSNPSMLPEWRQPRAFPMRTLKEAGVRTCIGTDFVGAHVPERPIEPMVSVELAVTHGGFGDEERLDLRSTLDAYTRGGAAAEGEGEHKGMLKEGLFGDVVLLSADLEKTPPAQLHSVEALLTVAGGRVVYRSPQLEPVAHRTPSSIGPLSKPPATIGPPLKEPPKK